MNMSGNTILITGGGSGIGRALAEAFHGLGNRVILTGRRLGLLQEVAAAHPGMAARALDVADAAAVRAFGAQVIQDFPSLNVVINNAGIMRPEALLNQDPDLADAEAMVATNLLGPIRLIAALLPHLQAQPAASIVNVSSGLAFLPLALTPTYSATKAAVHSYTQSLRYQLQGTRVEVLELAPPYVQTDLMGGASDPRAMPLGEFIAEAMALFAAQPASQEILVERVHPLRFAERNGAFDATFKGLNDSMSEAPHD